AWPAVAGAVIVVVNSLGPAAAVGAAVKLTDGLKPSEAQPVAWNGAVRVSAFPPAGRSAMLVSVAPHVTGFVMKPERVTLKVSSGRCSGMPLCVVGTSAVMSMP